MAEWLILALLVPAIAVPVVMLAGFAGCSRLIGIEEWERAPNGPGGSEFGKPIIDSAEGESVSIITLKWTYSDVAATEFEIERTKLPEQTVTNFPVTVSFAFKYDDAGLEAGTNYLYRVKALYDGGATSDWSDTAAGSTLKFEPAFDAEAQLTLDEDMWEGFCLIQRIEPAQLMLSGTQVRLTLRASSLSGASIDRIHISQPAAAGDAWDAASDLKEVATMVVVPANSAVTLAPIEYALDKDQPLLIAIDFTPADPNAMPPGPLSGLRYAAAVPPSEAAAFFKLGAEAAQSDRSDNYASLDRIYLIEKIEVG